MNTFIKRLISFKAVMRIITVADLEKNTSSYANLSGFCLFSCDFQSIRAKYPVAEACSEK